VSLCLHKNLKNSDQKLMCNVVGICPMVNARSGMKLVTFDLESYFCTFSTQPIYILNGLT